ncbi:MBL fold metallo-hydrolase [Paenibacillus oenotherae]|uniref:MBL fold metallo-hydrolase n=1 Tax=Paenibacillus oenotherae TaxID=1435645 RepID=A0ABS7D3K5_9BACL|nr:MBL fold metallo-hydrolase [Paenibacillus oenotherae]MBW7474509.1 MBL fold metallo-hydrolase [Paenibacillus oenotherae]
MIIQKLPWAGIHIQLDGANLVIDPLFNFPGKFNQPHEPFFPLNEFGPVDAVLITHHHGDHFDPEAISAYYGDDVPVYFPMESLQLATATTLRNVQGAHVGDSFTIGPFTATAAHSVDGMGDPQIAWIVEGGGKKLIHCGDTLWHGYWWKIAKAHGPFDAACLPVNAAVVEFPGMTPSGQPITLSPEQAVSAAVVLRASRLVPIHYIAAHHPPIYTETPDIVQRLAAAGNNQPIAIAILQSKELLEL